MMINDLKRGHVYRLSNISSQYSPYGWATLLKGKNDYEFAGALYHDDMFLVVSEVERILYEFTMEYVPMILVLGCNRKFMGWIHFHDLNSEDVAIEEVLS